MIRYSEEEIEQFISEPKKPLSSKPKFRFKPKGAHEEKDIDLMGENGNKFRLMLRQNKINSLDFSVILAFCPPGTTKEFRVCRYNGKHQHTNDIEKNSFDDYHIHKATARYQEMGAKEEKYAEVSDRYSDLDGALKCIMKDCAINLEDEKTPYLF